MEKINQEVQEVLGYKYAQLGKKIRYRSEDMEVVILTSGALSRNKK